MTFDAAGAPQPLPDRYVPGAFREWGVELSDWQTQCSSLCGRPTPHAAGGAGPGPAGPGSAPRTLHHSIKRLMPTVGCEADAVAFIEDVQDVWRLDGGWVRANARLRAACPGIRMCSGTGKGVWACYWGGDGEGIRSEKGTGGGLGIAAAARGRAHATVSGVWTARPGRLPSPSPNNPSARPLFGVWPMPSPPTPSHPGPRPPPRPPAPSPPLPPRGPRPCARARLQG